MRLTKIQATVVRVGLRVLVIPEGQPIPTDADVVYGRALPEVVYATFYEQTHCRRGHLRANGPGSVCGASRRGQGVCANALPDWSFGSTATVVDVTPERSYL